METVGHVKLPRLAHDAAWNYSSTLVEGAIGVLLVAFTVRAIGLPHYGIFVLALALAEILMLMDVGLFGVLPQAFVQSMAKEDPRRSDRLANSALVAMLLCGALALGVAAALALLVARQPPFGIHAADARVASIATLGAGAIAFVSLPATVLVKLAEASQRYAFLGRMRVALSIVRAAATALLLIAGFGVISLVAVQVADGIVRLVVLLGERHRWKRETVDEYRRSGFDWDALRTTWRPGKWALIENVANIGSYSVDSFIIGWRGSVGSAAIFAVGRKIPYQLWQLIQRSVAVTLPSLAKDHAIGDGRAAAHTYVTTCRTFFAPMVIVALALSASAHPLMKAWLGDGYEGAPEVLQWLLLATVFQTLAVPAINLLYAQGRIASSARIATVEGIANITLTLALVGPFGAPGAAAATAIVHGVATILFLFPAATRAAGQSVASLAGRLMRDAAAPIVVVLPGVAMLFFGQRVITSAAGISLLAILAFGALVLWGWTTGMPLWRGTQPGSRTA